MRIGLANAKRLLVLPMFALIAGGLAALWFYNAPGVLSNSAQPLASLSGFEPGTQIEGRITGKDDQEIALNALTGADGKAGMPLKASELEALGPRSYDLTIRHNDKLLNLVLAVEQGGDTLTIRGTGADPFERIVMTTPAGPLETKSDWSGQFEETGLRLPDDQAVVPVELALYGGVMNDASRTSPYIIKAQVVATPLGPLYYNNVLANYIKPIMYMAKQFSVVMMEQALAIGQFIDAKEQLEAQREIQRLKTEALKDYHPSEAMCRFGSYARSLASTEAKMNFDRLALNKTLMAYYTNQTGAASQSGPSVAMDTALDVFRNNNCDPLNNNGGLGPLCEHDQDGNPGNNGANGVGAPNTKRMNADIAYSSTIESPYTLDVDFTNAAVTGDEADILGLATNLYWRMPFSEVTDLQDDDPNQPYDPEQGRKIRYMKARGMMAMANLAHSSFTSIVAMKAKAPAPAGGINPGWSYMKTMMREFGLSDDDITQMMGENPSYYAQMDMLAKKAFQSPNFYTNLYDKPTNVERISASLEAVKLMQMRDQYESYLRREMLVSGLLEDTLTKRFYDIQGKILDAPR
jgi:hypothetical protein